MKAISARRPSFIEPMQALPAEKLPGGDWLYEVKLDGYRALAFKDGKGVRLVSRNQRSKRLTIPTCWRRRAKRRNQAVSHRPRCFRGSL
jgi:hypothetical protein